MIHSVDETAPVHSKEWGRNNTCIAASDEEIETGGSTNHNDLHLCEPEGEYYFDRLGISVDTIFASQRVNDSVIMFRMIAFLVFNFFC